MGVRKRESQVPFSVFLIFCLLASFLLLPGEPFAPSWTLALVGDVMLGRGVAQALDGDWGAAFAAVEPWLTGADVAFANLESPLASTAPSVGGIEGGQYDLRAPLEAVAALRAAGFDVVSLANNHVLDAGEEGVRDTVGALRAAGVVPLLEREVGELVGWMPVDRFTHVPFVRFLAFDDASVPLDVGAAVEAVAAANEQADVVVVSIHWGGEYQVAPSLRQRAIARDVAAAGADLIVGHGPHVLQLVEWVGETLVAYSLGNFLFDQPYPADCRWGAILRVTVRGNRIAAVEPVPTVVERGRVRLASPEDAAAILARLALDSASSIQHPASSIQ